MLISKEVLKRGFIITFMVTYFVKPNTFKSEIPNIRLIRRVLYSACIKISLHNILNLPLISIYPFN